MSDELWSVLKSGDAAALDLLLARIPELASARTPDGGSAVLAAIYSGRQDLAEILVARGAVPNLFEAAALGRLDLVRKSVDRNPQSVNARSHDGFTPLHLAAFFGHVPVMEYLLQKGAEVDAISTNRAFALGSTPLHSAVAARRLEAARRLIATGASLNAKDSADATPLYAAAAGGNLDMVRLLVESGANLNEPAHDGLTPLLIARDKNHAEVARYLEEEGATD